MSTGIQMLVFEVQPYCTAISEYQIRSKPDERRLRR